MPKTDEEWVTSPAQVVSDNTPPRHRLRLYEEEFAMTDHPPTVSKEAREAADRLQALVDVVNPNYKTMSVRVEDLRLVLAHLRTPAGEAGEMVERLRKYGIVMDGCSFRPPMVDEIIDLITRLSNDTEAMRLLREARRWMPAKGAAHADPDCYALCEEIDALAKGGAS